MDRFNLFVHRFNEQESLTVAGSAVLMIGEQTGTCLEEDLGNARL